MNHSRFLSYTDREDLAELSPLSRDHTLGLAIGLMEDPYSLNHCKRYYKLN
ncbi:hypothetical protein DPMN_078854 [Dreissena polymorpha]|uniref:Uncharacterized protein n=1 Tax=Dreissena polymorpha TaxID=45954 RepID=A0A9D3YN12_DREPO|nr:hypothetical protein DPMN_078854 [Dreissena polymorpha]